MAQRGQINRTPLRDAEVLLPQGAGPISTRNPTSPPDWAPSPDHYPRLKKDGGHLVPWNVRLSHVLCNREDYGWRMKISRMLEKGMSLEENRREPEPQGDKKCTWERHVVSHQCAESVRLLVTRMSRLPPKDAAPLIFGGGPSVMVTR